MRRMFSIPQLKEMANEVIESGQVDNAKPIYYHPIYLRGTIGGVERTRIQFCILNNSPTAFTSASIITKIQALLDDGAIINVNGYYIDSNSVYSPVYIINKSGTSYLIYYHTASSKSDVNISNFTWECTDGVNKIN